MGQMPDWGMAADARVTLLKPEGEYPLLAWQAV